MEQALTQTSRPNPVSIANPVPVVNRTQLQAGDQHLASGSPSVAYLPAANTPTDLPAGDVQAGSSGYCSAQGDPGAGASGSHASVVLGPGGEDPGNETPGRSPRRTLTPSASAAEASSQPMASREWNIAEPHALLAGSSDPLGEGLGLLAGMAIGLLTLVVPLGSVITDRPATLGLPKMQSHFDSSRLP